MLNESIVSIEGLYLENYVQEDLGNTSITVLAGEIVVELADRKENYSLSVNQSMQVSIILIIYYMNTVVLHSIDLIEY